MTLSNVGKQKRLDRLFYKGKTLIVPVDDSLIFGPKDGLLNLSQTIESIATSNVDAILGFKKDYDYLINYNIRTPFIFNLTASTILNEHTKKVMIASVENALIAGADCVAAHINFSSAFENDMIKNFSVIANECDRLGMPLLAIAYPRKEINGVDYNYEDIKINDVKAYSELIAHCTRVVCELGADIIKTYYTGDSSSFRKVIDAACGKPVIIAGGPKVSVRESLNFAAGALAAGGAGISFGRNVFNRSHIKNYLDSLSKLVHNGSTVDEAYEIYSKSLEVLS